MSDLWLKPLFEKVVTRNNEQTNILTFIFYLQTYERLLIQPVEKSDKL
jgi:hypothetical protein